MKLLAVLVIAAACGGSTPARHAPATTAPVDAAPPGPDLEAELARIEAIQRQACACPDVPCLEEADRAYAAYVDVATLADPIDGAGAWPDDLDARAGAVFAKLVACFDAKDTPLRVSRNHFAIRRIESVASHACACTDDACLVETRDALATSAAQSVYPFDDPVFADRIRGAVSTLGRCLAPVLDDVRAATAAALASFRDRGCACADPTCAGAVGEELIAWVVAQNMLALAVISDARIQTVFAELGRCLADASK